MKKFPLAIIISVLTLATVPFNFAQETSKILNPNKNVVAPNFTPGQPYVVDNTKDILIGPVASDITIKELKVSPDAHPGGPQEITFTDYQDSYVYNGQNYIKVVGNSIPTDYFLMVWLKIKETDRVSPYIIQFRRSTHWYDINSIFVQPISLGASLSLSFESTPQLSVSPLVAYQLKWLYWGDQGWMYWVFPTTFSIFLNPAIANWPSTAANIGDIFIVGLGLGFLDNHVLLGVAYLPNKNVVEGVFAINVVTSK